jgi:hypothetical protein
MKKSVVLCLLIGIHFSITGQTWIPDREDCSALFIAHSTPENNLSRFITIDEHSNSEESLSEIQDFINRRYHPVIEPEYSIELLKVWLDDNGKVDIIVVMITDNVALHPDNFELDDIPRSFQTDLRNIELSYSNEVLFSEIRSVFDKLKVMSGG